MVKIALTGGGTAGHVMPHIALLPIYDELGWEVFYIGSKGIEKELVATAGLRFETIQSGKLRRYFSFHNFLDIGHIFLGVVQSLAVLIKQRPNLVFSKGGFVSVPVAFAAWILRIPVVSHESDLTPGLANRLIKPFCSLIFYSFPETKQYLSGVLAVLAGIPVREGLLRGDRARAAQFLSFQLDDKPVMLVMGGSMGAERINQCLLGLLPELIEKWNVVHLTGKGKLISFVSPSYRAFEYIDKELPDLLALADLVVCRAGANSLFELRALAKPMLLIPLEIGSRGDQIDNAKSFEAQGIARVLRESDLTNSNLRKAVEAAHSDSDLMRNNFIRVEKSDQASKIIVESIKNILGIGSEHIG